MSTTNCPDCKGQVSKQAESCPHCGRPEPAKSAFEKEMDGCSSALGLLWLIHAIYAMWKWNFLAGVAAIFIGPFVWIFK